MTNYKREMRYSGFYEETLGDLIELTTNNQGFLIAKISDVDLVLPHEMKEKLRPFLGMRIGVLHTDIPGKEYLFRFLPKRTKDPDQEVLLAAQNQCNEEQVSRCEAM